MDKLLEGEVLNLKDNNMHISPEPKEYGYEVYYGPMCVGILLYENMSYFPCIVNMLKAKQIKPEFLDDDNIVYVGNMTWGMKHLKEIMDEFNAHTPTNQKYIIEAFAVNEAKLLLNVAEMKYYRDCDDY